MKVLLIGGTGIISTSISHRCIQQGWELYLLNRGNRATLAPEGAKVITADIYNWPDVKKHLEGMRFDVVANFIAYTRDHVLQDIDLFKGKTSQYLFISSASVYQKPLAFPVITESTPAVNPFWQYSRDKIACEDALLAEYRASGFPITIVRPSHTYDKRSVPVALHGPNGSFAVIERIRTGRKVIVPGDGLTLWTPTHSRDFAIAFCGLLGNVQVIGETFHITGDESLTWNQIYESIGRALGVKTQLVHIASDTLAALCPSYYGSLLGDKSNTVLFDNTKVKRAVPEYQAAVKFEQGVREAVSYIYTHEECQRQDVEFDHWCDAVIEQYEGAVERLPRFKMG